MTEAAHPLTPSPENTSSRPAGIRGIVGALERSLKAAPWWLWILVGPLLPIAFIALVTGPPRGQAVVFAGAGVLDAISVTSSPPDLRYLKATHAHELPDATLQRIRGVLGRRPALMLVGFDPKAMREGKLTPEALYHRYEALVREVEASTTIALWTNLRSLSDDGPELRVATDHFNHLWRSGVCNPVQHPERHCFDVSLAADVKALEVETIDAIRKALATVPPTTPAGLSRPGSAAARPPETTRPLAASEKIASTRMQAYTLRLGILKPN